MAEQNTALPPIAPALLAWFAQNKRLLPFRREPSAYHIWVSEIMLQQTRVAAALPYYERFIRALPDPAALAACPPDDLRKLWQGLGYYTRAANLQRAARVVCERYGGQLPADLAALRALPGIGDYTAGAIASIAFGIPAPAVDGNVLRVFARLYNDGSDITLPAVKAAFTQRVLAQMPKDRPGPYNEALMELGALVCVPGAPRCDACPLGAVCRARAAGTAAALPAKPPRPPKPELPVTVALVRSERGLLLQRRPPKGLLAGLWQPAAFEEALDAAGLAARLRAVGVEPAFTAALPPARHTFTHRVWVLNGWAGTAPAAPLPPGWAWGEPADYPIPSAFAACLKADPGPDRRPG